MEQLIKIIAFVIIFVAILGFISYNMWNKSEGFLGLRKEDVPRYGKLIKRLNTRSMFLFNGAEQNNGVICNNNLYSLSLNQDMLYIKDKKNKNIWNSVGFYDKSKISNITSKLLANLDGSMQILTTYKHNGDTRISVFDVIGPAPNAISGVYMGNLDNNGKLSRMEYKDDMLTGTTFIN